MGKKIVVPDSMRRIERDQHWAMTEDATVHEAILGLRRGGRAVILLTYRGDW